MNRLGRREAAEMDEDKDGPIDEAVVVTVMTCLAVLGSWVAKVWWVSSGGG